ncbi:MAG: aminotransferase [Gammaproteobacteria bacterium]|nr:aminotransferase [Gammaproteobacteria bacterium]
MINPLHNQFAPDSIESRDLESVFHPCTNLADLHQRGPAVRNRAEGVYIWDNQGRQYLEGMAGLWCTALGYGVQELADVAYEQMKKLSYSQLFASVTNEPSVLLAEKLMSIVPIEAGRVFFGLSGSDANDTQIKLMWHYHNLIGKPERKKIISRNNGYHGVTIGSGSLTGLPPFHQNFDLPMQGVVHASAPYYYRNANEDESEEEFATRLANELEEIIQSEGPETIAAFIAEPVMGAGGVIVPTVDYYEKIQRVLNKYGILFIDDEVICGFGRTGNPFGCQTMKIEPTTMTFAKALSSAYLPISGVVVPEWLYEPIHEATKDSQLFGHGFTYSGHPVCAAVALRNLELMDEWNVFERAAQTSVGLQEQLNLLESHPLVGDVRGVGMIGAVELVKNKTTKEAFAREEGVGAYCMNQCAEHGLIVRAIGNVVAICPPLIISDQQVDELFSKIAKGLDDTWSWVRNRAT